MSLHKKTHRMLLVLSFVYLTTCPGAHAVAKGHFDYSALSRRIDKIEQRIHKKSFLSLPRSVTLISDHDLFAAIGHSSVAYPSCARPLHFPLSLLPLR